jgi:hypothetical protein
MQRRLVDRQGVGNETAGQVLWRTEWVTPMTTTTTIPNQAPDRCWSFG